MKQITQKLTSSIEILFQLLLFFTPLIMFPNSSEIFEFNKMIFIYIVTILITGLWFAKMTITRKIFFRRTILDAPLILFILSQLLSTIFSIDTRTSLLGYYGRFNGGLLSTISYTLLYWAYLSNMTREKSVKSLKLLIASSVTISILAIFEHFGTSLTCFLATDSFSNVNYQCWNQDFQNRVYATLGQPNWLAAWIVIIIPLTWTGMITNSKSLFFDKERDWTSLTKRSNLLMMLISSLLFTTILFTKSRSGMLGFVVAFVVFWGITFYLKYRNKLKQKIVPALLSISISYILLGSLFGTPFTAPLYTSIDESTQTTSVTHQAITPNIPTNPTVVITDTLTIRRIVWRGAYDIWKDNKILGTGVETFAYSFPRYRPVEMNTTSEWNFLFNKAHNEYLNHLANSGIIGLSTYIVLIISTFYLFFANQFSKYNSQSFFKYQSLNLSLAAGWASILITSFFGFNVVSTSLLLFLFPAMIFVPDQHTKLAKEKSFKEILHQFQILGLVVIVILFGYMIHKTYKYWKADYKYAQVVRLEDSGKLIEARKKILSLTKSAPNESLFYKDLSNITSQLAVIAAEGSELEAAKHLAKLSESEANKSRELSSNNPSVMRNQAVVLSRLAAVDSNKLLEARTILLDATDLFPNDAKIKYNAALSLIRTGETETGKIMLHETINIKSNYKDPRYALALIHFDEGDFDEASKQLNYIIQQIDPFDEKVNKLLESITTLQNTN